MATLTTILLQHHPGHACAWADLQLPLLCLVWARLDNGGRFQAAPLHSSRFDSSPILSVGGVSVLGSLFMCLVTWSFAVPATFTGWLLLIGTGAGGAGCREKATLPGVSALPCCLQLAH